MGDHGKSYLMVGQRLNFLNSVQNWPWQVKWVGGSTKQNSAGTLS